MTVAYSALELERKPRAAAIGTFDGVHLGHRRVLEAAVAAGRTPTVVTFDPHPRTVLGNQVELIAPLQRRLELLAELGVEDVLVVGFTLELWQDALVGGQALGMLDGIRTRQRDHRCGVDGPSEEELQETRVAQLG